MKRFFIGLAGSSVLWGLVAAFGFYYALNQGYVTNETLQRYSTGHPVEYVIITMFFIGFCDLTLKLTRARRERSVLKRGLLFPPKLAEKEPTSKVDDYLNSIEKARDVRGDSAYLRRLHNALDFLRLGGSPDDLDLELRRLADDAYDDRDGDYGMARTFIWAIPILGFLGTVLGITVALGSLDLTQIESTSEKLAEGLKVAFDTTALALSLVFLLYFLQFFARRQDSAVERVVSRMVDAELKGRFFDEDAELLAAGNLDPSSKLLVKTLSDALEESSRRQAETLSLAIQGLAAEFGQALDQRLVNGSAEWSKTLAQAQRDFVEGSIKPSLDEIARRAARFDSLEDKVAQETEALRQTLVACAEVGALEERLAGSLEKLAQVNEFEKTLTNLNATVCMLNTRLAAAATPTSVAETRRAAKRNETLAALRALDEPFDANLPETYPLKPEVVNQNVDVDEVSPSFDETSHESSTPTPTVDNALALNLDELSVEPVDNVYQFAAHELDLPDTPVESDGAPKKSSASRSRALLSRKKRSA